MLAAVLVLIITVHGFEVEQQLEWEQNVTESRKEKIIKRERGTNNDSLVIHGNKHAITQLYLMTNLDEEFYE